MSKWIEIFKSDINPPVSPPDGKLNGANLYAKEFAFVKAPVSIKDQLFVNGKSALPCKQSTFVTFGENMTVPEKEIGQFNLYDLRGRQKLAGSGLRNANGIVIVASVHK